MNINEEIIECKISKLENKSCPYCEDDDFYKEDWKVPEEIPYMCPDPIRSYKVKLEVIHDPV